MEYKRLGQTGLKVSVIGFGGAGLGLQRYLTPEDRTSEAFQAEAIAALKLAADEGVNYFDTAPGYGNGRSERLIGRGLADRREKVHIGTKYVYQPNKPAGEYTEELAWSLERLQTDRVELLQLHGSTFTDARAEEILTCGVLDWADEMKARGCCRFTGLTAEAPSGGLERLIRSGRFDTLQVAYNLIYQSCCDYQRRPFGVIPLARQMGMGILTMRTPTSGFLPRLLSTELPDLDEARIVRMAIKFVLSTPEVDCALVGMDSREVVRRNVALAGDPADRYDLRQLHERYPYG
ncbi:MAG: aldo/keto reductase [Planctomycetota bacterium]